MGWEEGFMKWLGKLFLRPDLVPPDSVRRAVEMDGPQKSPNHRMQSAALWLRINVEHGLSACSRRLNEDFALGHMRAEQCSTTYESLWMLPVAFMAWESKRLGLWALYCSALQWIRQHASLLELCSRQSDGEVFVAGSRCGMPWNQDHGRLLRWLQRRPSPSDRRVIERAQNIEVPYQHLGIVAAAELEKDVPKLGALPILNSPLAVDRYGPDAFVAYSERLPGLKPWTQFAAVVDGRTTGFMRRETRSASPTEREAPKPMPVLPGEPVMRYRLGPSM